jgi:hypothetical protein
VPWGNPLSTGVILYRVLLLWDLVVLAVRAARAATAATARVMGKVLGVVLLARAVVQVVQGDLVKVILICQSTKADKIALTCITRHIIQVLVALVAQAVMVV